MADREYRSAFRTLPSVSVLPLQRLSVTDGIDRSPAFVPFSEYSLQRGAASTARPHGPSSRRASPQGRFSCPGSSTRCGQRASSSGLERIVIVLFPAALRPALHQSALEPRSGPSHPVSDQDPGEGLPPPSAEPATMHRVPIDTPSHDFIAAWSAAGSHLQSCIPDGSLVWLKARLEPPFLEHLSFRIGNQLFFVRLEAEDGSLKAGCGRGSSRSREAARGTPAS